MTGWASRVWRWLLRIYPEDFHYAYGSEMADAFDERCAGERGVARARFCAAAFGDVFVTAFQEHYNLMIRDLIQSFRRLVAHPVVAAIAILSLALGIGANTTMFSIVYSAILRPLPYPDSSRQMIILTTALNSPNRENRNAVTPADFIDWKAQSETLEEWHLFTGQNTSTIVGGGLPESVMTQSITPRLLESLGVKPVIGRFVQEEEDGLEAVAMVSERYWKLRFGGQPDVLGRNVTIGGNSRTIIGVVPAYFELLAEPSAIDFWAPIDLAPGSNWIQRSQPWLIAIAKLKTGVSVEQAQAELDRISAGLSKTYPNTNRYRGAVVGPFQEVKNGRLGSFLYPLLGAVAFVLLIACANVANLLLARATARRREISVRAALGASRRRLIREFLADGAVISIPGVVLGLVLAFGAVALFRAVAPPGFPAAARTAINMPVLLFTVGVATLAGMIAAFFPAMEGSNVDLTEGLKESGRGSAGRRRQRLRSLLVSGEIAVALILLAGAGLMLNSLMQMQKARLGFNYDNVSVAQFHLTGKRYMTDAPKREIDMRYVEPAAAEFFEHMLREVRALPGVENAAFGSNLPMGPIGSNPIPVRVTGGAETTAELRRATSNAVTPGFFETFRIPLRQGRYITEQDRAAGAWVAVVNEAFVREFFASGNALGQVIQLSSGPEERPREIVGIVGDYTQESPRLPIQPEVYTSQFQQVREIPGNLQGQRLRASLAVRSNITGVPDAKAIAKIAGRFDHELPLLDFAPLSQHVARRATNVRFYAHAFGLFAGIAVLLAIIGVYGLMSYSVTDRFHEIGIRSSLGASRAQILWLIISYGLKLAGAGLTAGILGALVLTRLLSSILFGVKPWDPVTFSVVTVLLMIVTLSACIIPAMRAARIDPAGALRQE